MTKIDIPEAIALLAEVTAGDAAYNTAECYYSNVPTDTEYDDEGYGAPVNVPEGDEVHPVCIVGHVVFKAYGREALLRLEEDQAIRPPAEETRGEDAVHFANNRLLRELGVTDDAIEVLSEAQAVQDRNNTWGEAFTAAQEKAAKLSV